MPRVLHVTPYMEAHAGGPPVVVRQLLAHAHHNGFAARVLSTPAHTDDNGAALRDSLPGLTLLPGQRTALHGAGWRDMLAEIEQADILHLHTLWSPLVAAAAHAARRRNIPYILSPHGMLDPYSLAQKRLKKRVYMTLVERNVLRGAACLLFTAEEERRLATAVTGPLPGAVIGLGAEHPPAPLPELRAAFLARHPELADRPRLLFMGRLHDKKRPESALRALPAILATCPDAVLLLAGSGPEEARLRALTTELGLQDAVRFTGFLDGHAKWEVLAAADLFLLPSRQENFGIALAEALHAGVPALITDRINIWQDMVAAGAAQCLNAESLEADLAARAIGWLQDPAARLKAATAASSFAAAEFDWKVCARRTHALYTEVLGLLAPDQPRSTAERAGTTLPGPTIVNAVSQAPSPTCTGLQKNANAGSFQS